MNDLILARAIHVAAVVVWIGGVSLVTTAVLPALRRGELGEDRRRAFEAVERRFVRQARVAVLLVGATGLYMIERLALWSRFHNAHFWWMHAMVGVWLVFALALFVVEPLALHRRRSAAPETAFVRLLRVHVALLALALVTILGAVAGSHGWTF